MNLNTKFVIHNMKKNKKKKNANFNFMRLNNYIIVATHFAN